MIAKGTPPSPQLRADLRAFIHDRGLCENTLSLREKLLWLQQCVDRAPISQSQLITTRMWLRNFGDPLERHHDNRLLCAFVRELLRHPHVTPPHQLPAPPIPVHTFRAALRSIEACDVRTLARQAHTGLLVMWCTGLHEERVFQLRKHHATIEPGRIILRAAPSGRRTVPFFIRTATGLERTAARAIGRWCVLAPNEDSYLLPGLDSSGFLRWDRPLKRGTIQTYLRAALRGLKTRQRYTTMSIRRAFLQRTRDRHGVIAAMAYSGFVDPRALFAALRNQPDWRLARNLF